MTTTTNTVGSQGVVCLRQRSTGQRSIAYVTVYHLITTAVFSPSILNLARPKNGYSESALEKATDQNTVLAHLYRL